MIQIVLDCLGGFGHSQVLRMFGEASFLLVKLVDVGVTWRFFFFKYPIVGSLGFWLKWVFQKESLREWTNHQDWGEIDYWQGSDEGSSAEIPCMSKRKSNKFVGAEPSLDSWSMRRKYSLSSRTRPMTTHPRVNGIRWIRNEGLEDDVLFIPRWFFRFHLASILFSFISLQRKSKRLILFCVVDSSRVGRDPFVSHVDGHTLHTPPWHWSCMIFIYVSYLIPSC